jgi:hypothetical protein
MIDGGFQFVVTESQRRPTSFSSAGWSLQSSRMLTLSWQTSVRVGFPGGTSSDGSKNRFWGLPHTIDGRNIIGRASRNSAISLAGTAHSEALPSLPESRDVTWPGGPTQPSRELRSKHFFAYSLPCLSSAFDLRAGVGAGGTRSRERLRYRDSERLLATPQGAALKIPSPWRKSGLQMTRLLWTV